MTASYKRGPECFAGTGLVLNQSLESLMWLEVGSGRAHTSLGCSRTAALAQKPLAKITSVMHALSFMKRCIYNRSL